MEKKTTAKKTTAKKGNQKKVKEVLLELVRYYDEDEKVFKEEDLPTGFQVSIDDVVCHIVLAMAGYLIGYLIDNFN